MLHFLYYLVEFTIFSYISRVFMFFINKPILIDYNGKSDGILQKMKDESMVKAIIIWKGVNWQRGDITSNLYKYEFIFNKCIIRIDDLYIEDAYKSDSGRYIYVAIIYNFLSKLNLESKEKFKYLINDYMVVKREGFNGHYFYIENYNYKKIHYFKFIFVYDNLFIFKIDFYVYILRNSNEIVAWHNNYENNELDDCIKNIFFMHNFENEKD